MSPGPDHLDLASPGAGGQLAPGFPGGLVLAPFPALRYDPAVAGDLATLTSPPYDVIDADELRALEQLNDHNVVRLILPRDGATPGDRYARAAETLDRWRAEGALRPDPRPALYVYEQTDPATGHAQRGLVGALSLSPPEDGIVLPHENTMAGPVADRLALYQAVGADLEPIFLVYAGGGAASHAVASASDAAPLLDLGLPDGLRHRLWRLEDPVVLQEVAQDLLPRRAVIADGHHRYATYLKRQAAAHAAGSGAGPWDRGLTFLVDAETFGPQVHPIHRVLPGQEAGTLAARAAAGARVVPLTDGSADDPLQALAAAGSDGPAFLLADGAGGFWLVRDLDEQLLADSLPPERSSAWRSLDVTVLHGFVVGTLFGLPDDEATVRYEHDVTSALAAARSSSGTAVLLNPTPVGAVSAVAAQGERMPRKSTLFTPKPRTGLLLRDHRDDARS